MPKWDYTCPECGYSEEHIYLTYGEMRQMEVVRPPLCGACHKILERQAPTGTSFSVGGFNAANGYSK